MGNSERPSAYQAWKQRRRALAEGKMLAREVKRGSKRYRHRLGSDARAHLESALGTFESVGKRTGDDNHDALIDAVNGLDKALDQHLSFARKSTAREYSEAIGTAVLIALFLRAFVVEAFKIPSGSMIPTLQVGDHIFVNKFIYGIRVPFTDYKIGQSIRPPKRGEVIVFIYPKDPDKDFIKRIIAVPGDTVEMRDDVLFVNDKPVPRTQMSGDCAYEDYDEDHDVWEDRTCAAAQEHLGASTYTTIYNKGSLMVSPLANTRPFTVPPHSVFCMGDNRDNSHDSRAWGAVPDDLIKGKAMVIWWSQGDPDKRHGPPALAWMRDVPVLRYLYGARYDRMFKLLH